MKNKRIDEKEVERPQKMGGGELKMLKVTPPWEIFENLAEVVYVVDPKEYKIVYLNKFGLRKLGYSSIEEIHGNICYKILQNLSEPCEFCPNSNLKEKEFYEWQYYNPVLKTRYLLKDTLLEYNGKLYKLEMTIDTSRRKEKGLVAEIFVHSDVIVKEFLKVIHSYTDLDTAVNKALELLGTMLNVDRTYIFEDDKAGETISNTYEWCKEGVSSEKDKLQELSKSSIESWHKIFLINENMVIENIEDIKETYKELYDILKPQNITSLVVSPLIYEKEIIGFFGVDNPPKEKLIYISEILSFLGHFIISTLKRRDLEKELQILSYHDQMTGAKNRNAFNKFIYSGKKFNSLGAIFCDVDGLKRINDTQGHLIGDSLIKNSYNLIREIFKENDIYRIGGDEFLILCENIDFFSFQNSVQELRDRINKNLEYQISVGESWSDDEKMLSTIEKLIDNADKAMYREKRGKKLEKYSNRNLRV